MAVEYSIPWISRQLQLNGDPGLTKTTQSDGSKSARSIPGDGEPVKTFVLFVRLPNWKKEAHEICTLRKVKDFTEVFQVKQLLELSAGIPAHAATLHMPDGTLIPDDIPLILGKNVSNGYTMHMKSSLQWEPVLKATWRGNLVGLMQLIKSSDAQNHDMYHEKCCTALFLAASKGDVNICKELIKKDTNPNYTTVFGNNFLHSAAFKGNLQVLQLLVAGGANVRSRNIQGHSAMDVAVATGFVECAKWLWLHQWSITITKSSSEESPKVNDMTSPPKKFDSKSTPYRLSFKKDKGQLVKPGTLHHSKAQRPRPKTAPARKPRQRPILSYPGPRKDEQNFYPFLAPEITSSLKREKSIPSIHECRSSSFLDVGVLGKINPLHSYEDHFHPRFLKEVSSASEAASNVKKEASQSNIDKTNPGKHEQTNFKHVLSNLHGSSDQDSILQPKQLDRSTSSPQKITPIEVIRREAIVSVAQQTSNMNGVLSVEREPHVNLHDILLESKSNLKTDKIATVKQIQPSHVQTKPKQHHDLVTNDTKSIKQTTHNKNYPASLESEKDKPDEKPLERNVQQRVLKSNHNFQEKQKRIEEDEIKKKQALKEKNDKAYSEWLATKQRETITKRKSEILNSAQEYKLESQQIEKPKPVYSWGITFEEWLKSKSETQKSGPSHAENDDQKRIRKKPSLGKSFDDWISDKNKQASSSHNVAVKKTMEDEKLVEMRKQKFDKWVSRKSEAARKERRKTEQLEQEKLEEMQKDYAQWKSKARVMSFEEWRKRKLNERRLSTIDNAQHGEVEYVAEWVSQERQELAERAFRRWLLRKQATDLQRAQHDLREAKKKRKKVEAKIQLRLERLRARKEMRRTQKQQHQNQEKQDDVSSDEENLDTLNHELTTIDNQIKNMTIEMNDKVESQESNEVATEKSSTNDTVTFEQQEESITTEVIVPMETTPGDDQNNIVQTTYSTVINVETKLTEKSVVEKAADEVDDTVQAVIQNPV